MLKKNKKGFNEVGIAIIVMGLLLLFGGVFMDSSYDSKSDYNSKKAATETGYGYPDEDYLFYLEEVNLGKQNKVTESFPNIELGSKEDTNVVFIGNSYRLVSNPFSTNRYEFKVDFTNPEDVTAVLIYFNQDRDSGDNPIIVRQNGKEVLRTMATGVDMPLKIPIKVQDPENFSGIHFSLEIQDVSWYSLFNWNKLDLSEVKIAEIKEDKSNKVRDFNFQIQEEDLERVYVDLSLVCDTTKEISDAIKVTVNGFTIANPNPNCLSRNTKITANVPLNILNEEKNSLVLETDGFYTVAYSINKIYFNDKDVYKFTVNSFNDLIDVVMYGDFDKSVIDLKLNDKLISLKRDEIVGIMPYLEFGVNEIEFLDKPIEIKEFVVEKSEFIYG